MTSRNADMSVSIIIHRAPEIVPLPYELRGVVSEDKWDARLRQARALCNQYSKPMFERIFLVFAVMACIAVPIGLHNVIFNAITPKAIRDAFDRDSGNSNDFPSNRFDGNSENAISKYLFETRWIDFGIFVGLLIVFWGPFAFWKRTGILRARMITTRWAVEDGSSGASFVPKWTIFTPGVFSINGAVNVTTPPTSAPTLFHPQAYMPTYITGPQQGGQQQPMLSRFQSNEQQSQIPYNPQYVEEGAGALPPHMWQGGAPGATPAYAPPTNGVRYDDEKKANEYGYEELKV